jgi:hypothetical protein
VGARGGGAPTGETAHVRNGFRVQGALRAAQLGLVGLDPDEQPREHLKEQNPLQSTWRTHTYQPQKMGGA